MKEKLAHFPKEIKTGKKTFLGCFQEKKD